MWVPAIPPVPIPCSLMQFTPVNPYPWHSCVYAMLSSVESSPWFLLEDTTAKLVVNLIHWMEDFWPRNHILVGWNCWQTQKPPETKWSSWENSALWKRASKICICYIKYGARGKRCLLVTRLTKHNECRLWIKAYLKWIKQFLVKSSRADSSNMRHLWGWGTKMSVKGIKSISCNR